MGILSGAVTEGCIGKMGDYYVINSTQAANPPRDRGDRDIDQISRREISLVIRMVRGDDPSLPSDLIIRTVANRFGFRRITEKLRNILEDSLND